MDATAERLHAAFVTFADVLREALREKGKYTAAFEIDGVVVLAGAHHRAATLRDYARRSGPFPNGVQKVPRSWSEVAELATQSAPEGGTE